MLSIEIKSTKQLVMAKEHLANTFVHAVQTKFINTDIKPVTMM
jgi:hypothetical protein